LTDGGLLLGSGTGAITSLGAASNGQIPIGDGTTDPPLGTITGSANIGVANGAGSITLSLQGNIPEGNLTNAAASLGDNLGGNIPVACLSNALSSIFSYVTVDSSPVSSTQATITVTCKDLFGNTLADEKTFQFWFTTQSIQTVPDLSGIDQWSFVAHGDLEAYWLLEPPASSTNYVYVGTTHTDGTMDFLVNMNSGPTTNRFSVLGPNGSYTNRAIAYTN